MKTLQSQEDHLLGKSSKLQKHNS